MNDVQVILNSFLREELDFQQLQRELSGALKTDPDARWQALGMLRELRGADRISHRLHEILKTEIQHGLLDGMEEDTQFVTEVGEGNSNGAAGNGNGNGKGLDAPTWTSDIRVGDNQEPDDDGDLFSFDTDDDENEEDNTRAVPVGPSKAPSRPARPLSTTAKSLPKKTKRPLGAGSVLKGRFVLESRLGRGGMGVVYKALDQRRKGAHEHSPYVALKVLREDFKTHPESLNALQRESHEAQRLSHPNIVNVFDFDRDGETYFMTMELLHGEPLSQFFSRIHPQPIPREEAFRIIRAMGQGLMFAHEHNVIHMDFKPGNVFLTESGGVKILDFGIAQVTNPPGQTEFTLGISDSNSLNAMTPAYASCERLEGAGPDPRDDVYALGCVAYELFAGKHPFNKKSALDARTENLKPEKIKDLSRKQWRALTHALALERMERTVSVGHFLDELGVLPADVSPYLSADTSKPTRASSDEYKGTHWGVGLGVVAALLSVMAYFGYEEIGSMVRGDWKMQRLVIADRALPEEVIPETETATDVAMDSGTVAEIEPPAPELIEAVVVAPTTITEGDITINTIGEEDVAIAEPPPAFSANTDPIPKTFPTIEESEPLQESIDVADDVGISTDVDDIVVDTTIAGTNDEPVINLPGTFAFAEDTVTVREGESAILVAIVRTEGDRGSASVAWSTNSVTADADQDYGHFDKTIETFAAGEQKKMIFIPLVSDAKPESNESFFVSIFDPSKGAKLGLTTQILITIIDDD